MNVHLDENSAVDQAHTARVLEERAELMRIAAARCIAKAEHEPVDEFTLAWARQIIRTTPPLGRPLSEGVVG